MNTLSVDHLLGIKNLHFVDPMDVIDSNCGEKMDAYRECFRDSDHLSDKSAVEIMTFIVNKYPFKKRGLQQTDQ